MTPILIAAGVSMLIAIVATGSFARWMRSRGTSQPILAMDDHNLAVPAHAHKAGTPTMGGVVIIGAAALGYLLSHVRAGVVFSDQTLLVWIAVVAIGAIGLLDDVLKVRRRHNRGVLWRHKGYITAATAVIACAALVRFTDIDTRLSFTRADLPGWDLGPIWWTLWAGAIVFATSNAVNVTDGLDGLAAGAGLFACIAFTAIAYLAFRNPDLYPAVVNPYDLAVLAAAWAGACAGFLWWNGAPAQIFMGDVGALALGATIGLLGLCLDVHLLIPLIAGIYVIEIGSVALQMTVYRASGRTRRLFKLSPIHHHFELSGWAETKVIIRFWLLAGVLVAVGAGIFIADFTDLASQR